MLVIAVVCGCTKVVESRHIDNGGGHERREVTGLCPLCYENDRNGKGFDGSPSWPYEQDGRKKCNGKPATFAGRSHRTSK